MTMKQFFLTLVAVAGLGLAVAPHYASAGCPLSDPACQQSIVTDDEQTAETAQ